MSATGTMPPRGPSPPPQSPPNSTLRRAWSNHWPIIIALPGTVVFWALGLAVAARLIIILPIAINLILIPRVRLPPRFGIFLTFVAWTFITSLQLPVDDLVMYLLLRFSQYIAMILAVLHIYNVGPRTEGVVWIRRTFTLMWLLVVALGLIAVVMPQLVLPSVTQMILPGSLANDPFIQDITTPALAQVQSFLGFDLPRPAAPFAYTNGWGSAYSLLLPFVIATAVSGDTRERRVATAGLAVSIIPAVISANRAMWASVLLIFVWLVFMTADPGLRRNLRRAAVAMAVVLVVAGFSPLGSLVASRLDTPHSNNARSDLASETSERILERPVLGYGGPIEYEGSGIRPPVGTQGHLWGMSISNGLPAALLFLLYFAAVFPLLRGPELGVWTRASVLAMGLQLPFYDILGAQLLIVMVAVAGSQRETAQWSLRSVSIQTAGHEIQSGAPL